MSAPLIVGASIVELLKSAGSTAVDTEVSWALTLYGCLIASVFGYFSLKLLVLTLKGRWFWLFGPYCMIAGVVTLVCC